MRAILISVTVFGCLMGGAFVGMFLRNRLAKHHLNDDSYRALGLVTGLVVTMSGLVIGMLVSSGKASFEARQEEMIHMSANVVLLDRLLANYGPETQEARNDLRSTIQAMVEHFKNERWSLNVQIRPSQQVERVYDRVLLFTPKNAEQALNKAEALRIIFDLRQTRWLFLIESGRDPASLPLLVILASWLTAVFVSFGLIAPQNSIITVALCLCALAVSAAIFMIVQLNSPLEGVIRISTAPLQQALSQLGK